MLQFLLRLMMPAWVVQSSNTVAWRPLYFRWLIVALVILVCVLYLLGVVQVDERLTVLMILALAIAGFVP